MNFIFLCFFNHKNNNFFIVRVRDTVCVCVRVRARVHTHIHTPTEREREKLTQVHLSHNTLHCQEATLSPIPIDSWEVQNIFTSFSNSSPHLDTSSLA